MSQFERIARALNRVSAGVAALLLVYVLAHILFEILLRVVFDTSTYVLDEFIGYAVAAITFLGLGYALETNSLIRVDVFVSRLDPESRRGVELTGVAATFAITVFSAYWVGRDALRNFMRGAVSESVAEVPLWIPVGAVWLGLVLFAIQLAAYFLRIWRGGAVLGEADGAQETTARAPAPASAEAEA